MAAKVLENSGETLQSWVEIVGSKSAEENPTITGTLQTRSTTGTVNTWPLWHPVQRPRTFTEAEDSRRGLHYAECCVPDTLRRFRRVAVVNMPVPSDMTCLDCLGAFMLRERRATRLGTPPRIEGT